MTEMTQLHLICIKSVFDVNFISPKLFQLNMNDLPCEILVNIFRLLDVVDSKNVALTCKLWKNVIEDEFRWSLKLNYDTTGRLRCTHSAEHKINFIMTTNRKFRTIEMVDGHLTKVDQTHDILLRHGLNVVELTFRSCSVDNLTVVAKLLHLTPNLNYVSMDYFDSGSRDTHLGQISPELKKLRKLDLCLKDQRIVQCFQGTKLREIRILEYELAHHSSLVDFICSQDTLTSLTIEINNTSPSILADLGKLNVPFRLTQLAITGSVDDDDNLLRFVKSQAQNLVELELISLFPSLVYECIIGSMPKLNTLSVEAYIRPPDFDIDFYDGLETNCTVRTVKLLSCDGYDDHRFQLFGRFLKKLPNVRGLIFSNDKCLDKSALVMIRNLDKLESLALGSYIGEHSFDTVKLPNLKTLHIQNLHDRINWNEFTKAHPLLTEFTIETMSNDSYLTSDDIDQMTTNVGLQHLTLGVGFVVDDRFLEVIRTKCKNLKILDLHKSCLPHRLKDNVGINVLRLCNQFECSKTFRSMFD